MIGPFSAEHELICRDVIYNHSQSFFLSSLLLPPEVRLCAWAIYGFCRTADDAVDVQSDVSVERSLEDLRRRLDLVYGGCPESRLDEAFSVFVHHYDVPRSIPECLLSGFEIDTGTVDFQTEQELIEYSFKVASMVGLMLVYAMKSVSDVVLYKACDLGIAMQLTNVTRDMGADLRMGRIYVPAVWREEACASGGQLNGEVASDASRVLAGRLLEKARDFYASACQGIQYLPLRCQVAISASKYVYAAIGKKVEGNGFDTISTRARVSVPEKVFLVACALGRVVATPYQPTVKPGPADNLIGKLLADLNLGVDLGRECSPEATGSQA